MELHLSVLWLTGTFFFLFSFSKAVSVGEVVSGGIDMQSH